MGYSGQRKRLPLTPDILAKIKPLLNFTKNDDRAFWAILCVGVFSLARIGELLPGHGSKLRVTVDTVTMRDGKGSIHLIGTKTDVHRRGMHLTSLRITPLVVLILL